MVRRCSHLINALRPKRLNLDSSDNKQVSVVGSTGTKAAGEQGVVQKERHSRQMRANDDLQPDRPAQTQLVSAAGRAGAAGRGNGIASEVSRHILARCHFDPLRQKIRCRATEPLLGCCRGERYRFLAICSVLGRSNRLRHGGSIEEQRRDSYKRTGRCLVRGQWAAYHLPDRISGAYLG